MIAPLPHDMHSERVFTATPSAIFAAFADAERLARWWGPAGAVNVFETFEFRPGGRWSFIMHMPDGTSYPMQHRFVTIDAPERIVIAHDQAGHDFTLAVRLEPVDATHTLVRWHMRFASDAEAARVREFVQAANEQNLDRLAEELAPKPPSVMHQAR